MNKLAGVASGDMWREFNTTNEMWPSIDASKDVNNEMTHSKIKSYSSIVRTAQPPPEDRKVGLSLYFTYTWFGHDVK